MHGERIKEELIERFAKRGLSATKCWTNAELVIMFSEQAGITFDDAYCRICSYLQSQGRTMEEAFKIRR